MIAKRIQADLQRQGFAVGDPLKFVDGDFGGKTHAAVQALQVAWATAMSSGPSKERLPTVWLQAFEKLGNEEVVKRIQMQRAYDRYFVPCAASAATLGLASELGIALAFDVHVQNGGFKPDAFTLAAGLPAGTAESVQRQKRAACVADSARPQYKADVLSRKNTIATGQGLVHGGAYTLAAWGLGEEAAA